MGTKSLTDTQACLIIFTCQGREHMLERTYNSFMVSCGYKFSQIILAIDGPVNESIISHINPDLVIYSYKRNGYVASIINALTHVKADYFFWLEDDFIFNQKVPVDYMLDVMAKDKTWAGIFLSRTAPLTEAEKKQHHFDGLYVLDFGFSVSPSFCNTQHVKDAFTALANFPKNEDTKHYGFEPFIDEFFVQHNLKYAVIDPGTISHVDHIGYMESTAREYHMINSVDKEYSAVDKNYISGLNKEKTLTLYNKLAMLPKVWLAVFVLSFKLLKGRQAYDFAFRIYRAYLKKFKF